MLSQCTLGPRLLSVPLDKLGRNNVIDCVQRRLNFISLFVQSLLAFVLFDFNMMLFTILLIILERKLTYL